MQIESFNKNIEYGKDKVVTKLLLETPFSKEIRILLAEGQSMKEHKTAYPIAVHVLEGEIEFGVQGNQHTLHEGDIISLEANIPHDLTAKKDSVVRLTLSKSDSVERVEEVVKSSNN